MAGTTEHYALAVGVVTDDVIEPEHHNRLAATLDRVLGNVLKHLLADGVHEGWEITEAGTITAGEGLVAGCWCQTLQESEISGLTAGARNYVFARTNTGSAPEGSVEFFAQLAAEKLSGAVYLGTVDVDSEGQITGVDSHAPGVDRNCWRLEIGQTAGSGVLTDVEPGEEFRLEITHEARFLVPGRIEFECEEEQFSWTLQETWRGDGFVVTGKNEGTLSADFVYTWERYGLLETT